MAPTPEPEASASGAVGFLDLPPEIRNTIYELSLIVYLEEPSPAVGILCPDLGKVQRQLVDLHGLMHCRTPKRLGLAPNLLATCKQVYNEALPVLYGNNCFLIAANTSSVKYTRNNGGYQLPSNVYAMRIVEIRGNQNQAVVRSLFLVLQNMLALNTLRIHGALRRNFQVPKTMVKALLPLVQGMHGERMGTDRKQAMDVIEFTNFTHWTRGYYRRNSEYAGQVEDSLRASLKLA